MRDKDVLAKVEVVKGDKGEQPKDGGLVSLEGPGTTRTSRDSKRRNLDRPPERTRTCRRGSFARDTCSFSPDSTAIFDFLSLGSPPRLSTLARLAFTTDTTAPAHVVRYTNFAYFDPSSLGPATCVTPPDPDLV